MLKIADMFFARNSRKEIVVSHHLSGPNLKSPAEDARLDLTDVFAFTVADGERTVPDYECQS